MDVKNDFNGIKEQCDSSLGIGLYCIWDTQLKQYDSPFSCSIQHLDDYMSIMVNDVQSRFYGKEDLFTLVKLGEFDNSTGVFYTLSGVEHLGYLSKYIKQSDRNLQIIIKTLNYLPTGYFKMPAEMKQEIQSNIDKALEKYVSDYVVPDIDVSSKKIELLENKIKELENNKPLESNS